MLKALLLKISLLQCTVKKIRNYFYDEAINIQVTSIIALIHCGKITISDTLKESESFKRLENNVENRMLMHPRDIIYFLTFYKKKSSKKFQSKIFIAGND